MVTKKRNGNSKLKKRDGNFRTTKKSDSNGRINKEKE